MSEAEKTAQDSTFYVDLMSEMFAATGDARGPTRMGGGGASGAKWKMALVGKVIGMLDVLKQPAMPERPVSLPTSNLSVRMSLDTCHRKGDRAPATDREIRDTFSRWRDEIVKLEGESAGRLGLLLFAHNELSDAVAGGELGMESALGMVAEHICNLWLVDEPFPRTRTKREAWMLKACRRTDLIPNWLLSNLQPPLFIPGGSRGAGGGDSGSVASDDFLDEE